MNKYILHQKLEGGFEHIKKQTATKNYFTNYKFVFYSAHFLLCFSSNKNDATKCPKRDYKTRKIDPFTRKYELIVPKQQKLQKSV